MKENEFLERWRKALESYGTPGNFADEVQYTNGTIRIHDGEYEFVRFSNSNHAVRRELMAKQAQYTPKGRQYGHALTTENCFLCQNIAQAIDIGDNQIEDLSDYLVLPNRYPPFPGSLLFIPKNHDDTSNRTSGLAPEEGKTRANIVTPSYLYTMIEYCEKNKMVGLRNHLLDGMSIPEHDHFQLSLRNTRVFHLADKVLGNKEHTEYATNIFKPENTPFDTICISGRPERIAEDGHHIVEKMERSNEVFTLLYINSSLFIGSRNSDRIGSKRFCPGMAGTPVHYTETFATEYIREVELAVPKKGNFHWEKYIP